MIRYGNPYAHTPQAFVQYKLGKEPQALSFSVIQQAPVVSAFLRDNKYQATNGMIIATDNYPEFKDSKNTIYLQGDSDAAENFSTDITTFSSNYVRDGKYDLIVNAIQEMVDFLNGKPIEPACSYGQVLNIRHSTPGITNFRNHPEDFWNAFQFVAEPRKVRKVKKVKAPKAPIFYVLG